MVSIRRGTLNDAELLANLGKTTFLEAHGHSASPEEINEYVSIKFSTTAFETELKDPDAIFYIMAFNNEVVGYSKLICNAPHANITLQQAAKLERLYILQAFHGLKLGYQLLQHNINEALNHNQTGMWLFVWTENHKAINFYKNLGFNIVGRHDFQITATRYNPNHQMLLTFKN